MHPGREQPVTAPYGSTSAATAKYASDPATSITAATSMIIILFRNFISQKSFLRTMCTHISRVYGLRTYSLPDFRKSAAECTAVPVGYSPRACPRFSNCRDSSVSPKLSDSHAPRIGSFLKYAGIISSILRRLTPVSVVWLASGYSIPYPTYPVNQILQNSYISPHFTNCSHSICTKRLWLQT